MVDAHDQQRSVGISRRGFFAGVGAAGVAGALAACAADSEPSTGARRPAEAEVASPHKEGQLDTVTFDGPHQAGIATPHQAHAVVIAYNFAGAEANRTNMRRLMTIWTGDARAMTSGGAALADLEAELGASPANLTITVGWGPRLIDALKLTGDVPHWCRNNLHGLPAFEGDQLDPAWGEADLCLQICGDDLTTVSHAARVLTRGGQDYVRPVWSQRGFVNVRDGETPRNLLGFKDGTAIPRTEEEYDAAVWDDLGGSAMVVRRVVYDMPDWEALDRAGREEVFGRTATEGAPLGAEDEFDEVDLNKTDEFGIPYIDRNSHVGLSAGEGTRMRRRAYNWDGEISAPGNTGLIFICFQDDPDEAFTPLQRRLAAHDRLNRWVTHVGSAVFWVPPGTQPGTYWGKSLLDG